MAKVAKVLDGDTFETASGKRVRLANVNAPEIGKPGADEATAKLRELIDGKNIYIDPVGTSYGRVVANITVEGESVNSAMRTFINPLRSRVSKFWESINSTMNRPINRLK